MLRRIKVYKYLTRKVRTKWDVDAEVQGTIPNYLCEPGLY